MGIGSKRFQCMLDVFCRWASGLARQLIDLALGFSCHEVVLR